LIFNGNRNSLPPKIPPQTSGRYWISAEAKSLCGSFFAAVYPKQPMHVGTASGPATLYKSGVLWLMVGHPRWVPPWPFTEMCYSVPNCANSQPVLVRCRASNVGGQMVRVRHRTWDVYSEK
jgi:hypothetical protein